MHCLQTLNDAVLSCSAYRRWTVGSPALVLVSSTNSVAVVSDTPTVRLPVAWKLRLLVLTRLPSLSVVLPAPVTTRPAYPSKKRLDCCTIATATDVLSYVLVTV
jgi:hypothetical protein